MSKIQIIGETTINGTGPWCKKENFMPVQGEKLGEHCSKQTVKTPVITPLHECKHCVELELMK